MIKELIGGTSNKVYLLNNSVILRLHGVNSNILINHDKERYIIETLSSEKLSPNILYDFGGGHLEEYISNSRPLTTNDILHNDIILINTIKKLKELHAIELNFYKDAILIDNIHKWTTEAAKINQSFSKVYELKGYILNKLMDIKTIGIVLCHNYLQKNNILINKDDCKMAELSLDDAYKGLADIQNETEKQEEEKNKLLNEIENNENK